MTVRLKHITSLLLLQWAKKAKGQACTVVWAHDPPQDNLFREQDKSSIIKLDNWGYTSATCASGSSLSVSFQYDAATLQYMTTALITMTGSIDSNSGDIFVDPYWNWTNIHPIGCVVNVVDNTGYVYRSTRLIVGTSNSLPGLDDLNVLSGYSHRQTFDGICQSTLDASVGSTDFVYLDSPGSQSFQLFDMTQPLAACSSPPEILNADGVTWDPLSSDAGLSVNYNTGQLTVETTDVGKTTRLRIGTTQFKLHRCEYTYFSDSANGIPITPTQIGETSGPTNEFVLPKVHLEPSASCPAAQNPTITGIAASNYSTGSTDDSDKFNIFIAGTSFTPSFTPQTVVLQSDVEGKSSPVEYSFSFLVSDINPICIGLYSTTETDQLAADYPPTPTYIIDDSFNQDFVFPANPNADFSACSHSLKFKGADISSYTAISVTKRASDFLVNLNMSNMDLSLYAGQSTLELTHGTGSISLTIVLCQVAVPTIATNPYMTVVKSSTSPALVLPAFTTSHSQCHDILTYTLTVSEPQATHFMQYDASTDSHTVVLDTSSSVFGTYSSSYQAQDQNTAQKYSVSFNVQIRDDCMSETASTTKSSIQKKTYIDASSPHLITRYGAFSYSLCGQTVNAFSASCIGSDTSGTPCTATNVDAGSNTSPTNCNCLAVSANLVNKNVVLSLADLPAQEASQLIVYIKGWSNEYGQEPTNHQLTITLTLVKCTDKQFLWNTEQLNAFETYIFKSGLQNYQFGWPAIKSSANNQCQPNQNIEVFFGQKPAEVNINTDSTISSVFTLIQTDPANLVFTINTDHNMNSLIAYSQDAQLPINIPFHIKVTDTNGQIQALEHSFNVIMSSDCSRAKTPILDPIVLSEIVIDVGGQQKCTGPLEYANFFKELSDQVMCPVDILADITLTHDFGFESNVKSSKSAQQIDAFEIFKLDDDTFEICFQAASNDQIKGYQVNELSKECLLESNLACAVPFQVKMQSQDGTLGTIYQGFSIWNRQNLGQPANPTDDKIKNANQAPFIQDFDTKEQLYEIAVDSPTVIEIGPIIDQEGDQVFVEMLNPDNKEFAPWITSYWLDLDAKKKKVLFIEVSVPKTAAGSFTSINLEISDRQSTDGENKRYKFVISVAKDDKPEQEKKETESDQNSTVAVIESHTPQEDTEAIVELEDPESDFKPKEQNSVNETITVNVRQPDYYGVLEIEISRSIRLPANYTSWTSSNEGAEMLSIEFVPSNETVFKLREDELAGFFSWSVLNRTERREQDQDQSQAELRMMTSDGQKVSKLDVQLQFSQPLYVSSGVKELDQLKVKVNENFFEAEGVSNFTTQYEGSNFGKQSIEVELQRQVINKELIEVLEAAVEATEQAIIIVSSTNLFASIFITGLLQYLWALINALQMITHAALFSTVLPINTQILMFSMLRLGNLDIYNTADAYQAIFNFKVLEPFNALFSLAGYDSTNFIIESGMLLFGIVAFALYQLVRALIKRLFIAKACQSKDNWLTKRIKRNQNLHVQIKRFFMEGCFGLGLAVAIQLCDKEQWQFEHVADSTSFAFAVAQIVIYILLVVFIVFAGRKVLKKTPDHASYKLVFSDLRTNKVGALAYDVAFLFRRFLVISLITVLADEPIVQIQLYLFASLGSLLFLVMSKPFDENLMNKGEIMNEFGILLVSYSLPWFTDYVIDPEQEFDLGWAVVAVILLVVLANMVLFGIALVRKIKLHLKKWKNKWTHAKQKKTQSQQSQSCQSNGREDSYKVETKVRQFKNLGGNMNQVHQNAESNVEKKDEGKDEDEKSDLSSSASESSIDDEAIVAIALVESYKEVAEGPNVPGQAQSFISSGQLLGLQGPNQNHIGKEMQLQAPQTQKLIMIDTRAKGADQVRDSDHEDQLKSMSDYDEPNQTGLIPISFGNSRPSVLDHQWSNNNSTLNNTLNLAQTTTHQEPLLNFTIKAVDVQQMQQNMKQISLPKLENDDDFHIITPIPMPSNLKQLTTKPEEAQTGLKLRNQFISKYAAEKEKSFLERTKRLDSIQRNFF